MLLLRVLEQERARARPERLVDVLVEVERRQHDDARARAAAGDLARRLDAVEARHADVHEHDVRAERVGLGDGLVAVARLADDLDVRLGLEDHPEAGADEALVVCEQDADHRAEPSGSRARSA